MDTMASPNRPQSGRRQAILEYLSSDFQVVVPGDYVLCAVTKAPIPLDDLRYWRADTQEAFATPQAMLDRHKELVAERGEK